MCKYVYTYACVCVYLSLCSWTFICLHIYACVIDSESGHTSPKESWMSPRQTRSEGPEPQRAVKCKARPNPDPGGAAAGRTPLISRALRQDLPSRCSGGAATPSGGDKAAARRSEWGSVGPFTECFVEAGSGHLGLGKAKRGREAGSRCSFMGKGVGGWLCVCMCMVACVFG